MTTLTRAPQMYYILAAYIKLQESHVVAIRKSVTMSSKMKQQLTQ